MATLAANQFAIPSGAPSGGDQDMISFDGLTINDSTKNIGIGIAPDTNRLHVDGNVKLGGNLIVGKGAAGVDYTITIDGETNDLVLRGMEDEDYWRFDDDVLMNQTERLFFLDTSNYIQGISPNGAAGISIVTNGKLAITGDIEVSGAAIFNNISGDKDFQVNWDDGIGFFVQGSDGDIGFGTNAPNKASSSLRTITVEDAVGGNLEMFSTAVDADNTGIAAFSGVFDNVSGNNGLIARILYQTEGGTAGNRGGRIFLSTKADGSSTFNNVITITEDEKVGINKVPTRTLDVVGSTFVQFERQVAGTNNIGTAMNLIRQSPDNMVDGFGVQVAFVIEDSSTVLNTIGLFSFVRNGADNSGKFQLSTYLSGSSTVHQSIDSLGKTILNASAVAGGDLEVLAQTSGIAFKIDVSTALVSVDKGNFDISATGKGLGVKAGAVTDSLGTATLVAGTVTVANTNIATGDKIILSRFTAGGTLGFLDYTISNGTSFTINSSDSSDTSVVDYQIIRAL